jgi:hypothetical protein
MLQTEHIVAERIECLIYQCIVNSALMYLRKVAASFQEVVCRAWGEPAALRYRVRCSISEWYI